MLFHSLLISTAQKIHAGCWKSCSMANVLMLSLKALHEMKLKLVVKVAVEDTIWGLRFVFKLLHNSLQMCTCCRRLSQSGSIWRHEHFWILAEPEESSHKIYWGLSCTNPVMWGCSLLGRCVIRPGWACCGRLARSCCGQSVYHVVNSFVLRQVLSICCKPVMWLWLKFKYIKQSTQMCFGLYPAHVNTHRTLSFVLWLHAGPLELHAYHSVVNMICLLPVQYHPLCVSSFHWYFGCFLEHLAVFNFAFHFPTSLMWLTSFQAPFTAQWFFGHAWQSLDRTRPG